MTPVRTAIEGIVNVRFLTFVFESTLVPRKVRELVRSSFEDDTFEESFAMVDPYLAIFPKDRNIEIVSVAVILWVLKAVELAIAFLLSSTGKATFFYTSSSQNTIIARSDSHSYTNGLISSGRLHA